MEPRNTLRFALNDRFNETEVGPKHVPAALLAQFAEDVADFLKGSDKDLDLNHVSISIEEGSLTLVASGLLAATSLWTDVQQLQSPSALGLIDPKRAAVVEQWQALARKNPHRSYRLADKNSDLNIRVDGSTDFRNQLEAVWVPVEKYLEGQITDWGGTTKPNVHLKLKSGKVLTIAARQELIAAEEKNRVYKPGVLRISAEENLQTRELRNLNLLNFEDNGPVWDEKAFENLLQKGATAWADVPDSWLEELRGGQK